MAFQFSIATPPFVDHLTMSQVLTSLGLSTNLKLVLDASDSASYTSGQKWLDRSGGGYDFFLGADGSATTTDPTFNGTAGGRSSSEYWSFDGGDYFTYDTTNESWMNNLHKDNAKLSWAAWIYDRLLGGLWGTCGSGSTIGALLQVNVSGSQTFLQRNGGSEFQQQTVTGAAGAAAWNFVSGAVDEAAGAIRFNTNGTAESFSCTYNSPSASSATYTMQIGTIGNATNIVFSGKRIASLAVWEGTALSAADLTAIFTATRTKFGV